MIKRLTPSAGLAALVFLLASIAPFAGNAEAAEDWVLNDRCPAGFAPDEDVQSR